MFSNLEIEQNPLVPGEGISWGQETFSEDEYKSVAAFGSSCHMATDVSEANRSTCNDAEFSTKWKRYVSHLILIGSLKNLSKCIEVHGRDAG